MHASALLSALFATAALAAPAADAAAMDITARGSPMSGVVSVLETANYWRRRYNLPQFAWDDKLAGNALKTGTDDKGDVEKHELNPGSMGQVIAPGIEDRDVCGRQMVNQTPFGLIYLGWLCEKPSDSQLSGDLCPKALKAANLFMTAGVTGHHDILLSKSYTKIGCAFARNPLKKDCDFFTGLWICDVA